MKIEIEEIANRIKKEVTETVSKLDMINKEELERFKTVSAERIMNFIEETYEPFGFVENKTYSKEENVITLTIDVLAYLDYLQKQ